MKFFLIVFMLFTSVLAERNPLLNLKDDVRGVTNKLVDLGVKSEFSELEKNYNIQLLSVPALIRNIGDIYQYTKRDKEEFHCIVDRFGQQSCPEDMVTCVSNNVFDSGNSTSHTGVKYVSKINSVEDSIGYHYFWIKRLRQKSNTTTMVYTGTTERIPTSPSTALPAYTKTCSESITKDCYFKSNGQVLIDLGTYSFSPHDAGQPIESWIAGAYTRGSIWAGNEQNYDSYGLRPFYRNWTTAVPQEYASGGTHHGWLLLRAPFSSTESVSTCPSGYSDNGNNCKKEYTYYTYDCSLPPAANGDAWTGPLVNSGGDCQGNGISESSGGTCFGQSSTPPEENCLLIQQTCPVGERDCIEITDGEFRDDNTFNGYEYKIAESTEFSKTKQVPLICPVTDNKINCPDNYELSGYQCIKKIENINEITIPTLYNVDNNLSEEFVINDILQESFFHENNIPVEATKKQGFQYKNGKLREYNPVDNSYGIWIDLTDTSIEQDSIIVNVGHKKYNNGLLKEVRGESAGAIIDINNISTISKSSIIGGYGHIEYKNGWLREVFGTSDYSYLGDWVQIKEIKYNLNPNKKVCSDGYFFAHGKCFKENEFGNEILLDNSGNYFYVSYPLNNYNEDLKLCSTTVTTQCGKEDHILYDGKCIYLPSCENMLNGECYERPERSCENGYIYDQIKKDCVTEPICLEGEFIGSSDSNSNSTGFICKSEETVCPTEGFSTDMDSVGTCSMDMPLVDPLCPDGSIATSNECRINIPYNSGWSKHGQDSNWIIGTSLMKQTINTSFDSYYVYNQDFNEFSFSFDLKSANGDDDVLGLTFGFKDKDNNYVLALTKKGSNSPYCPKGMCADGKNGLMLLKKTNGIYSHLMDPLPHSTYGWNNTFTNLKVVNIPNDSLRIWKDDILIVEILDAHINPGKIGLYTFSQPYGEFKDFITYIEPTCSNGYDYNRDHNLCYKELRANSCKSGFNYDPVTDKCIGTQNISNHYTWDTNTYISEIGSDRESSHKEYKNGKIRHCGFVGSKSKGLDGNNQTTHKCGDWVNIDGSGTSYVNRYCNNGWVLNGEKKGSILEDFTCNRADKLCSYEATCRKPAVSVEPCPSGYEWDDNREKCLKELECPTSPSNLGFEKVGRTGDKCENIINGSSVKTRRTAVDIMTSKTVETSRNAQVSTVLATITDTINPDTNATIRTYSCSTGYTLDGTYCKKYSCNTSWNVSPHSNYSLDGTICKRDEYSCTKTGYELNLNNKSQCKKSYYYDTYHYTCPSGYKAPSDPGCTSSNSNLWFINDPNSSLYNVLGGTPSMCTSTVPTNNCYAVHDPVCSVSSGFSASYNYTYQDCEVVGGYDPRNIYDRPWGIGDDRWFKRNVNNNLWYEQSGSSVYYRDKYYIAEGGFEISNNKIRNLSFEPIETHGDWIDLLHNVDPATNGTIDYVSSTADNSGTIQVGELFLRDKFGTIESTVLFPTVKNVLNISCPSGSTLDPETNLCITIESNTAPKEYFYDFDNEIIFEIIVCNYDGIYNATNNTCEIEPICPNGESFEVFNNNPVCSTPPIFKCNTNNLMYLNNLNTKNMFNDEDDYLLGACKVLKPCQEGENTITYNGNLACSSNSTLIQCPEGYSEFRLNGETQCIASPTCPDGYVRNGFKCELEYKWYEYKCPVDYIGPNEKWENTSNCEGNFSNDLLKGMYIKYLNRCPDQGGYDYWLSYINSNNITSEESFAPIFCSTAESNWGVKCDLNMYNSGETSKSLFDCDGTCGFNGCQCNSENAPANSCRKTVNLNPNIATLTNILKEKMFIHFITGDTLGHNDMNLIRGKSCTDSNFNETCEFGLNKITTNNSNLCFQRANGEEECFYVEGCYFNGEISGNNISTLFLPSPYIITDNSGGRITSSCKMIGNVGWESRKGVISSVGLSDQKARSISFKFDGTGYVDDNKTSWSGFNAAAMAFRLTDGNWYRMANISDINGSLVDIEEPSLVRTIANNYFSFVEDVNTTEIEGEEIEVEQTEPCKYNDVILDDSMCSNFVKLTIPDKTLKVDAIAEITELYNLYGTDLNKSKSIDINISVNNEETIHFDGKIKKINIEHSKMNLDNEMSKISNRIRFWDSYLDGYVGFLEFVHEVQPDFRKDGYVPEFFDYEIALGYGFTNISLFSENDGFLSQSDMGAVSYTYFIKPTATSEDECNDYADKLQLVVVTKPSGTDEDNKLANVLGMNYNKSCILGKEGVFTPSISEWSIKKKSFYGNILHKCSPYKCEGFKCGIASCKNGYSGTSLSNNIYSENINEGICMSNSCDIKEPWFSLCGKTVDCENKEGVFTSENNQCQQFYCNEGYLDLESKTCKIERCPTGTVKIGDKCVKE